MRVKLLSLMAGPDGVVQPGGVVDLPDEQARSLVAGGYAEMVDGPTPVDPAPVETATVEPPEVAVTRRSRPRGREE